MFIILVLLIALAIAALQTAISIHGDRTICIQKKAVL